MILPTHIVASGGVITNNKNEVLLVRNPRKGWEYPGGIIEPGETLLQGLIREIKEEALRIVNSKQQLRFRRALNYKVGFSCLGYQVNSLNEIEVHEEYLFIW